MDCHVCSAAAHHIRDDNFAPFAKTFASFALRFSLDCHAIYGGNPNAKEAKVFAKGAEGFEIEGSCVEDTRLVSVTCLAGPTRISKGCALFTPAESHHDERTSSYYHP